MLPDPLRILMVAYAARDLSPRRRRAAERLLKHSPEARELLKGLRSDAALLRDLPRRSAPSDLEGRVLRRIPGAAPSETSILRSKPRWPIVINAVVAISAVFCVTVVSLSMLTLSRKATPIDPPSPVARELAPPSETPIVSPPAPVADPPARVPPAPAVVASDSPTVSPPAPIVSREPAPAANTELGSPPLETPHLASVVLPRLPEWAAAESLSDSETLNRWVGELAGDDSHRIDVFCRDGLKALERIQTALKQIGIRTLSDSLVQEMQKRRIRGTYILFTSDLNAADWGRVLQSAIMADQKAEVKKPGDGTFDQMVLMPLHGLDQKELTTILGHDAFAQSSHASSRDSRRPGTSQADEEAPTANAKADVGKGARLSIAMVAGRSSHVSSAEIRQFVQSRRSPAPGSITVVLVFRTVG